MPIKKSLFPLYFLLLVGLPLAILLTFTAPPHSSNIAIPDPIVLTIQPPHKTLEIRQPLPPLSEEDDKLLRLASLTDPSPRPGRSKKVAFMFLTTTPLPFAPLWEMFFNQTPKYFYNVYIHASPDHKYDPSFTGVFENRVIRSERAFRRTPTLISAARRLLANALLHDSSNYMFVLLSPSCVPLHSFNFTYEILVSSARSFVEILKNEPGWYDRWAARGPEAMLPEVKPESFRIGSQFWAMTRQHARMVVSDVTLWNKFNQPCIIRHTCYPEEHYFPTLLHMLDPRGCVPVTLTHVNWSVRTGGHPLTYKSSEVSPVLIQKLRMARPKYGDDGGEGNGFGSAATGRNHPFLFARKFSPAAVGPLLSIAKNVIFNDSTVI